MGSFTQEDPAKDGLNLYVYCGGNPMNRWDPSGMYEIPEVMVRFAIEKVGGTVNYNANTGATTVRLGGNSATIRAGEYGSYVVNDRLIIKAEGLARALYGDGYSESQWSQFAPSEGQSFDRAIDAALAFACWYGPVSRNNRMEYGAAINYYGANDYRLESIANSYTREIAYNDGSVEMRVNIIMTERTTAAIHTHWHPNGSLEHSEGDIETFPIQLNGYPNYNYSYVVKRHNAVYVMSRWHRESARSKQI